MLCYWKIVEALENDLEMRPSRKNEGPMVVVVDKFSKLPLMVVDNM